MAEVVAVVIVNFLIVVAVEGDDVILNMTSTVLRGMCAVACWLVELYDATTFVLVVFLLSVV